MTMTVTTEDYTEEEAANILNGQRLLSEADIAIRWNYDLASKRNQRRFYMLLYKLRKGRHRCGTLLPTVNIDSQRRRYHLKDVLSVELSMMDKNT